ncbi:MAG TPA: ROK family protein [Clostridia bacterium]|nr:ROK family protein [Clostridia bacterium]
MSFIGIDLGATEIKTGIVSKDGQIINKATAYTPIDGGVDAIVDSIDMLITELLKTDDKTMQPIRGIGIGIPGVCSNEGLVYYAPNLFWNNVPLGDLLREKTNLPVFVANDATMAVLGEATYGVAKGVSNCVLITLGTGIGGGIIINGDVYSGSHGIGSEIGHIIVGENFYNCNCGNNGCLETFSSATALIKYTEKLLSDYDNSLISEKVSNDVKKLDAKLIFDCAKEGDFIANKAVDRLVKYLAIGTGNIINILDPGMVVIGGGISKAGNYLIDKLNKEVPKNIWLKSMNLTKIVSASLGNDAGIIGSVIYARSKLNL